MTDSPRPIRAYLGVAVVLPLLVTAVGVAVQVFVLPRLPDPVAIHWSASGPDGFGAPWSLAALIAGVGVGLTALFAAIAFTSARGGEWSTVNRALGAMVAGFVPFLVVAVTWSTVMQAGLADAAEAPGSGLALLGGLLVAVPLAAVGWFLQPRAPRRTQALTPAVQLVLDPHERAVWLGTARMTPRAVALVLVIPLALILVALAVLPADQGAALLLLAVAAGTVILALGVTAFRVRVDDRGLSVRSLLGLPRFRVGIDDVAGAASVTVDPLAQFGGWGLRWGAGGRFGVVLRGGEALEVARRDRSPFVVTVDDADTAASLLQALRTRA
ncbi:DUF1648 domain-containing protein [Microbacterium sp. P05]|uniref:DUF1648 domain-containing protein n=1 Tax=Microbacterium sp. P05 TaxID=3366948 RepID=UPI003746FB82